MASRPESAFKLVADSKSGKKKVTIPRNPTDPFLKMLYTHKLSPTGLAWLVNALDPYHDYQIEPCGYPDAFSLPTLTYKRNAETVLKAPIGMAADKEWDCHIMLSPLSMYGAITGSVGKGMGNILAATSNSYNGVSPRLGILNAFSYESNSTQSIYGSNSGLQPELNALDFQTQFASIGCAMRLVSIAFEVHNTTKTLEKCGSVRVYRTPILISESDYGLTTMKPTTQRPVCTITGIPATQALAAQLRTTDTWSAKEGCYVQGVIKHLNPITECTVTPSFLTDTTIMTAGRAIVPITLSNDSSWSLSHLYNIESSGAIFSGLSSDTTLQLTLRAIFEICPFAEFTSALYNPITKPSPPADPNALNLYQVLIRQMPSGVKVSENSAGDFFRRILKLVQKISEPVGAAAAIIPQTAAYAPGISAIGAVAGQLSQIRF